MDKRLLCRRWVHSREEDTATEVVYRPADFPLPASRGRSGLQFAKDGTFKEIGIGATDISNVKEGAWRFNEQDSSQVYVEVEGKPKVLKVDELKPDRMTLKRDHDCNAPTRSQSR
jgi:hypothetical protein